MQRYSLEIAAMLLSENAKTVVVACNTASAVALSQLTATLPVTVTGVIQPGAEAAITATRNGHVGVIGTRATINSGAYERALRLLDPKVRVSARACPLLVPLIEEGWLQTAITDEIIMQYVSPLVNDGIDTLVLGCTHYPLLREAMARLLGDRITLVDSAQNCANAVRELLLRENLCAAGPAAGRLQVALTDQPDSFLRVAREALQLDVGEVQVRERDCSHAPVAAALWAARTRLIETRLQQFRAFRFRQALHDQIVGMIDHFFHLSFRDAAAQLDRVPVLLVHVITRLHLFVAIAQLEREIRIAFQIHPRRHFVEGRQGEHFALDLEDDVVGAKRRALRRRWFL